MTSVLLCTGMLSGGVLEFSGRIHYLVGGSHVPCHTIMLLYRIHNFSLSYDNLQPMSYNILTNTKEVWARPGMTCACGAALGSHGRSKLPVCVYCTVFTYCRCMTRGWVAGLILLTGDPGRIK